MGLTCLEDTGAGHGMLRVCWHLRRSKAHRSLPEALDAKQNRIMNLVESRAHPKSCSRSSDGPFHVISHYNHSWIVTFWDIITSGDAHVVTIHDPC